MVEVDGTDTDVSYVAIRRPLRQQGEMVDYEIELYQELPPGVTSGRREAHIVGRVLFGILAVDDAMAHTAHLWLMRKVERFRWTVWWHDTLAAAEQELATRIEAEG